MDTHLFWKLIQQTKRASHGEIAQQMEFLTQRLEQLSADDIIAFEQLLIQFMDESYRADLWGAAYLINGGCSDDGFDYFRGWLVAQGRREWEAALAHPDSLAEHPEVRAKTYDVECEDMLSALGAAYDRLTGEKYGVYQAAKARGYQRPARDLGEDWDFDDPAEVRRRLP